MIHPEEKLLLRSICKDSKDKVAKLAYADWCEENNILWRAEFIRQSLRNPKDTETLASMIRSSYIGDFEIPDYFFKFLYLEKPFLIQESVVRPETSYVCLAFRTFLSPFITCKIKDGFVSKIETCFLCDLLDIFNSPIMRHPIEKVEVLSCIQRAEDSSDYIISLSNSYIGGDKFVPKQLFSSNVDDLGDELRFSSYTKASNFLSKKLISWGRRRLDQHDGL